MANVTSIRQVAEILSTGCRSVGVNGVNGVDVEDVKRIAREWIEMNASLNNMRAAAALNKQAVPSDFRTMHSPLTPEEIAALLERNPDAPIVDVARAAHMAAQAELARLEVKRYPSAKKFIIALAVVFFGLGVLVGTSL